MSTAATTDDPYLWLEDVDGDRALDWVRARNVESRAVLEAEPGFEASRRRLRDILDSRQQIPQVVRRGDWLYNFWRDAEHPRGLWRRTTMTEYRRDEPDWAILLDLDALADAEGENWVWAGAECLGPGVRRCLVALSRGGADATVVREFDVEAGRFVDGGFALPEAKTRVTWADPDTLYVGTDFGPGSLTDSGYPRVIKRWRRGQPLAQAEAVFEGRTADVSVWAAVDHTPGHERTTFGRNPDFYTDRVVLLDHDQLRPLAKPDDATLTLWRAHALLELRSDWSIGGRHFPRGSLLAAGADDFVAGRADWRAVFTPTATRSLAGLAFTRTTALLTVLDQVASRIEEAHPGADGWTIRPVDAPHPGTLAVQALHDPLEPDDPLAESMLVQYTDFLTPDSLMLGRIGGNRFEVLKSRPAHFDGTGMRVEQGFATSRDGTSVPYFVVWPAAAAVDGDRPTLLYGYGGFEVSMRPAYSAAIGSAWLERGGVYVLANLRGGGEFGPAWHQAATGANKQRSYDDFVAVAEALLERGITRPARLGIQGGSNGGLLVGAVMVQRPELFGAVVCKVPLLDMRRYHRLLAGASWMAEYGDPDRAEDWDWIGRYSPYQNVRADRAMPPVLFTTSTRDDRVHPGHARKMAARMIAQGHRVLYVENIEGGHGGAADNAQLADKLALEFAFLWRELGPGASAR